MKTVTGYLTGYSNPHFSGLAEVRVSDFEGVTHTLCIESGFGTRQLVAALGGTLNSFVPLTLEIGPMGQILSVAVES